MGFGHLRLVRGQVIQPLDWNSVRTCVFRLDNRRHGREDVTAGRTIAVAMDEVEQATAGMPDRAAEVRAIRHWLEGAGTALGVGLGGGWWPAAT